MAYQGNQIDYNNLNDNLKTKIDKTEDINDIKTKVNNSWQINKYNATSSMNLGDVSHTKAFRFRTDEWKSTTNVETLFIIFPTLTVFSGVIKITIGSSYNNTNAGGGCTVEYNTQFYSGTLHKYSKTITTISPDFAQNYYLNDLTLDNTDKHLLIPIFKAPSANNFINIEVTLIGNNIPNDIMQKAYITTIDEGSPTALGYPWTPQASQIPTYEAIGRWDDVTRRYSAKSLYMSDVNQCINNGEYFINEPDSVNMPYKSYWLLTVRAHTDVHVVQTARNVIDGNEYERQKNVDWNEWTEVTPRKLFTSVSNGKAQVASAITGKGVQTASDATFETMANNIRAIPTGSKVFMAVVNLPAIAVGGTATVSVNTPFKPTDAMLNLDGAVLSNGIVQGTGWINRHSVYDIRPVDIGNGNWTTFFDIRGGQLGGTAQTNRAMLSSFL